MSRAHEELDLDAYLKALEQRNAAELERAKEKLGERWLLHPVNRIKRKEESHG